MNHVESRQVFLMTDGAKLYVDSSRHSEFESAMVAGETNFRASCGVHDLIDESYEGLSVGWAAEKHANAEHGGLVMRQPIAEV